MYKFRWHFGLVGNLTPIQIGTDAHTIMLYRDIESLSWLRAIWNGQSAIIYLFFKLQLLSFPSLGLRNGLMFTLILRQI